MFCAGVSEGYFVFVCQPVTATTFFGLTAYAVEVSECAYAKCSAENQRWDRAKAKLVALLAVTEAPDCPYCLFRRELPKPRLQESVVAVTHVVSEQQFWCAEKLECEASMYACRHYKDVCLQHPCKAARFSASSVGVSGDHTALLCLKCPYCCCCRWLPFKP